MFVIENEISKPLIEAMIAQFNFDASNLIFERSGICISMKIYFVKYKSNLQIQSHKLSNEISLIRIFYKMYMKRFVYNRIRS